MDHLISSTAETANFQYKFWHCIQEMPFLAAETEQSRDEQCLES